MKTCPGCANEVHDAARKCQHCHTEFGDPCKKCGEATEVTEISDSMSVMVFVAHVVGALLFVPAVLCLVFVSWIPGLVFVLFGLMLMSAKSSKYNADFCPYCGHTKRLTY
jgi:hypothetical protein